jgi:transcriptional regulator with PAS, ATPase and Fis domain
MNTVILGENGVGKTTLAFRLHQKSQRKNKPFIKVNLASLTENLFESELFGHKKGSFTGAIENKIGLFELAQGGTLFLDEIGEIDKKQQQKLLDIFDEKTFYRVGCHKPVHLDADIIVATNKDLVQEVEKGRFRKDLFFRLCEREIYLESIHQSPKKSEIIANQCLKPLSKKKKLSQRLIHFLHQYHYPGNYRELSQLKHLLQEQTGTELCLSDLPRWVIAFSQNNDELPLNDYWAAMSHYEKKFLINALSRNKGKINETSRKIRLSKSTLLSKIKKYGIHPINSKQEKHLRLVDVI